MQDINQLSAEILQNNLQLTRDNLASKVFNTKLAALRAQNPFIPILPIPDSSIVINMGANVNNNINLPSGTKIIRISRIGATAGLYCTVNGAVTNPSTLTPNQPDYESGTFVTNENMFIYVEEMQSISLMANAGIVVCVSCWSQL